MKNDPAFPNIGTQEWPNLPGLTKLEWFAGMALSALKIQAYSHEVMAYHCFELAEAMVAEAERRSK